ncbi:AhpA/YtjB family protein [Pseudocolwellia agarivorans]|uniref:AhpA/YtjB family protein n=1 Tax=Pseudocolwellia agarivorans TaxID=1911682 RepID=UPI000984971B|nr:AhpA/YtjB family protein [Pseudocolwellia agarivorans]
METSNLPLYPKLSSIYNKLMQLAIAIVLIIVLLNLWVTSNYRSEKTIHDHFYILAEQHLEQAVSSIVFLQLIDNKVELQKYVDGIASAKWIYDVHIYDETGKTIAASKSSASIKDVYGITLNKSNKSDENVPFIQEIRTDKLIGFMRITVKQSYFTDDLNTTSYDNHALLRLMMIIAVCIGFLLTRGLNRFSRQGFRPPTEK